MCVICIDLEGSTGSFDLNAVPKYVFILSPPLKTFGCHVSVKCRRQLEQLVCFFDWINRSYKYIKVWIDNYKDELSISLFLMKRVRMQPGLIALCGSLWLLFLTFSVSHVLSYIRIMFSSQNTIDILYFHHA